MTEPEPGETVRIPIGEYGELMRLRVESVLLRQALERVVDASTWSAAVQTARAALSNEGGDDG